MRTNNGVSTIRNGRTNTTLYGRNGHIIGSRSGSSVRSGHWSTPVSGSGVVDAASGFGSSGSDEDDLLQAQLDSLSGLQRLTDSLGLTNFRGQIYANYKTAMDERDYNSIQSVVAREQQAGLNADLLGAQGSESDVAGNMIDGMQAQGSGAFLESFGNNLVSFIQSGMSIASGILSFETLGLNRDLAVLGGMSGDDMASEFIDALGGDFLSRNEGDLSSIQTTDELRALSDNFIEEVIKDGSIDYFQGLVKNKRLRSRLNEQMKRKLRSASGKREFYDAISSTYKSHYNARLQQAISNAAEGKVIEDENGAFIDVFDKLGDIFINSEFVQAMNNLKYLSSTDPALQAQAENAQNQYSADYYQSANGIEAAEATNATNKATKEQSKWAESLDKMRNNALDFLNNEIAKCDDTKEGKRMKTFLVALKYLMPTFLGGSMLQMPNLPFTINQNHNNTNKTTYNNSTSNIDTINSVHN